MDVTICHANGERYMTETVVKEKLKRKVLELYQKEELFAEDLKTAENRLERAQEIQRT